MYVWSIDGAAVVSQVSAHDHHGPKTGMGVYMEYLFVRKCILYTHANRRNIKNKSSVLTWRGVLWETMVVFPIAGCACPCLHWTKIEFPTCPTEG